MSEQAHLQSKFLSNDIINCPVSTPWEPAGLWEQILCRQVKVQEDPWHLWLPTANKTAHNKPRTWRLATGLPSQNPRGPPPYTRSPALPHSIRKLVKQAVKLYLHHNHCNNASQMPELQKQISLRVFFLSLFSVPMCWDNLHAAVKKKNKVIIYEKI